MISIEEDRSAHTHIHKPAESMYSEVRTRFDFKSRETSMWIIGVVMHSHCIMVI